MTTLETYAEVEPPQYPADPESWDEAVASGIFLRQAGDVYGRWGLGWLADMVANKAAHGDAAIPKLAAAIGISAGTLKQYRWVASGFTPEEVQQFPRTSFAFFRLVRRISEFDKEEAFSLLEKADTNGWRYEDLENEILGLTGANGETLKPVVMEGPHVLLTLRPVTVETIDGTQVTLYLATGISAEEQAVADDVYEMFRRAVSRDNILADPNDPDLPHRRHFVNGVRLPANGLEQWIDQLEERGLFGTFITQISKLPLVR